jgi:hypothetical protein
MDVREEIKLNGGESLRLSDNGEGWLSATYHQAGAEHKGLVVGIGRNRREALESAQATLQNALNIVDIAIERGR